MILELINNIRTLPGCEVLQSIGLPDLPSGLGLPNDVEQFYSHCGGMNLFRDRSYPMTIVSPTQFLRANPEIAMVTEETGDISDRWFIIGKHGQQYVTIDLDHGRLGRCYDSFWDRHALAGGCPVIAKSFSEFLDRLIIDRGSDWYWRVNNYAGYGDAYD